LRYEERVKFTIFFQKWKIEFYDNTNRLIEGILDDCRILYDKYAIEYLSTDDVFITLGGVENGETFEEACVKELMEEAGLIVKPIKEFLVIREYKVPNEVLGAPSFYLWNNKWKWKM